MPENCWNDIRLYEKIILKWILRKVNMSVNRINLAWDKTWWRVLAKLTMTTLVT
jgi:hypothetical protein